MSRSFRLPVLTAAVVVAALIVAACAAPLINHDVGTPGGPTLPSVVPPGGPALRPVTMQSGLDVPTNVEFAQNGRVWVAEHAGTVQTYDSIDDPTPTLAVDITASVRTWGDHGLLGMAIDPQFPTRPYLYVQYATDPTGLWGNGCPTSYSDGCKTGARLERITLDANGVATGERVTLADNRWCYQFSSHAIGDLKFLPDGTLLSGSGDGSTWSDTDYGQFGGTNPFTPNTPLNPCGDPPGAPGVKLTVPTSEGGSLRSQDLLTPGDPVGWNGSIVRLDPDTGAPATGNPLAGGVTTDDDAIVAHGLRNPYRYTVDPVDGSVIIGDVGWTAYEEIDRFNINEGFVRNFGWPCEEGPYDQAAWAALKMNMCALAKSPTAPTKLTKPVAAFYHNHAGAALSGIAVITPGRYDPSMDQDIAFADYVNQRVYSIKRHADGTADPTEAKILAEGLTAVDLQEGPGGYLYAVDIAAGTLDRLVDKSTVPQAALTPSVTDGPLPLAVTFDASASVDPTGHGLTYSWDLDGDGQYDDATGPTASRTFTTPTNATVGVRVVTTDGVDSTASVTLYPGNTAPHVAINVTSPMPWVAHQNIAFTVSATDDEQGTLPVSAVSWSTQLQHCESETDCHLHPISTGTASLGGAVEGPSHEFPSYLRVSATATDARGESTTIAQRLDPASASLTVNSTPSGASVAIGSETYQTPKTVEFIKGSDVVVSAVTPQTIGGFKNVFNHWSDGGAASHSVVVDTDKTIGVIFNLG